MHSKNYLIQSFYFVFELGMYWFNCLCIDRTVISGEGEIGEDLTIGVEQGRRGLGQFQWIVL